MFKKSKICKIKLKIYIFNLFCNSKKNVIKKLLKIHKIKFNQPYLAADSVKFLSAWN